MQERDRTAGTCDSTTWLRALERGSFSPSRAGTAWCHLNDAFLGLTTHNWLGGRWPEVDDCVRGLARRRCCGCGIRNARRATPLAPRSRLACWRPPVTPRFRTRLSAPFTQYRGMSPSRGGPLHAAEASGHTGPSTGAAGMPVPALLAPCESRRGVPTRRSAATASSAHPLASKFGRSLPNARPGGSRRGRSSGGSCPPRRASAQRG